MQIELSDIHKLLNTKLWRARNLLNAATEVDDVVQQTIAQTRIDLLEQLLRDFDRIRLLRAQLLAEMLEESTRRMEAGQ